MQKAMTNLQPQKGLLMPTLYEGKSTKDLFADLKMELAELAAHGTESDSCTGEIVSLMVEVISRCVRYEVKKAMEGKSFKGTPDEFL